MQNKSYKEDNDSELAFTYRQTSKLTEIQEEIQKSLIIAGDFNTCIAVINPTFKKLARK